MTVTSPGKPGPSGAVAAEVTPRPELDSAVEDLRRHRHAWAALGLGERLALLAALRHAFRRLADRWVAASREIEGIAGSGAFHGEEWLAGPYCVLRNLRLLEESLADLAEGRPPRIPGPVTRRPDGRAVARIFPGSLWDRVFFPGVTAEVWMEPGVTPETLAAAQAAAYREAGSGPVPGRVALVLGGGNVSSIGPMDTLFKLFAEKQVVLYKSHPVQDRLGPLFEEAFGPLIDGGFVRVVYGGADVGTYLVHHPGVDEVHMTGSDRTYEAIVFGPGEDGARRRREGRPQLDKPVTAELGNVSPVIVVPGPWSDGEVAYQAENVVSMLTNNAGFNCNAARVVVTHAGWARRDDLLAAMRRVLASTPTRPAFYPGAAERCERFLAAHPDGERFGAPAAGELPWVLLPGLDAGREDDIAFRTEAFSSVFGETALAAPSAARFVDRAVEFCNERLWGTLNVTLIVHPDALRDPETAAAVDRALADLRYGTVSINHWAAVGYALASPPWGSIPGQTPADIQSGTGWVHNTFLFDRPEKTVVRSPFRVWPKPPWFVSHQTAGALAHDLAAFEADPGPLRVPSIFWHALRG